MVKKRIAIIPARGGSKRIENKNIIDFCGKPMIAWTIEAAKKSALFDRIVVSTEDNRIAEVSIKWGADVPFFRTEHIDDYTPVSMATIFALQQANQYWNESYQVVVQLMANCPLRAEIDIKNAVFKFEELDRDFQISCFKFGWMNPWWATKIDSHGLPERLFPETSSKRSQDLPELYCPTGAIWVAKAEPLMQAKTFYGPNYTLEPLSWENAVDIDNYEDLQFAELLYQKSSIKYSTK